MKKISILFSTLLFLTMAFSLKAGNYSFTVTIPNYSTCDYTVCAFVSYKIAPCNGCTPMGYSTAQQCASIPIGGTNVFNINTPAGSTFDGVYFAVSNGSFYHIFSTNDYWATGNCNALSNPFTIWEVLSPTSFTLEGQNVLKSRR